MIALLNRKSLIRGLDNHLEPGASAAGGAEVLIMTFSRCLAVVYILQTAQTLLV